MTDIGIEIMAKPKAMGYGLRSRCNMYISIEVKTKAMTKVKVQYG